MLEEEGEHKFNKEAVFVGKRTECAMVMGKSWIELKTDNSC